MRRLHVLASASTHALQPGVADLLDMLRIVSVEVVEAINTWRSGLSTPVPFRWNGINYLSKMPSDLDFLNSVKPLTSWLGFPMERNPFVIPLAMDQRPSTGQGGKPLLTGHKTSEGANADPGFTSVGNAVPAGTITSRTSTSKKGKSPTKSHPSPFSTPVINDPSLLSPKQSTLKSSTSNSSPSRSTSHHQSHVTPSTIGDLDLLRVRSAEKAILAEEAIAGRYLRSKDGRLVPAWQAGRERFGEDVAADDGRALGERARVPDGDLAPFAEQSGFGLDPRQPGDPDAPVEGDATKRKRKKTQGVERPSGRKQASKLGGSLHQLTTAGTSGRKKAPSRRSRGAILDMDITRKQKENEELEATLTELRNGMEVAEGALSDMEAEIQPIVREEGDAKDEAATVIQSEIRMVEAQTKVEAVKKRRAELEAARAIVAQREKELEGKRRELKEKEEQRLYFKAVEKRSQDARRARELERKRRMLDENQVLPEDEEQAMSLEDISSTSIQRIARGRQARAFYKRYKEMCERAATIIQGGIRGMFDRKIVRDRRLEQWASTTIKRLYRGRMARMEFKNLLAERSQSRAASKIQTQVRGQFGRNRMNHKRSLVSSAKRAFNAVSVRQLFPADLQELADAIQAPLIDVTKAYLPASVLGLIKIVCLSLGAEDKKEQLAHYSRIGVRTETAVDDAMTWETAMKVLRRSSKLLRRMRALASGPANRRPRLLHLPEKAVELFKAYEHDPSFTVDAMRRIGRGAKACIQLLTWASSLFEVFDYQLEFLDDIGDVQPGWLQKLREQQKEKRKHMIQLEIKKRSIAVAGDAAARAKASGKPFGTAQAVMVVEAQEKVKVEAVLEKMQFEEDVQEKKEKNEEQRVLGNAEEAVAFAERDVKVAKSDYKKSETEANLGSELDRNRLPKLRAHLIEREVILRDANTQFELIQIRMKKDDKKRNESKSKLDGELLFRCSACGEANALYMVAKEEKKVFAERHGGMKALGGLKGRDRDELGYIDQRIETAKKRVNDMKDLLKQKVEVFELECKKQHDAEAMMDAAPQGWDTATETELEEDRREDEVMAQEEMEKMKEFVSVEILDNKAERPRPLLVCISRDVPMVGKAKLLSQILSDFEGMFVRVSLSENQGVDVRAFQAALDAGSSIIVDVDSGISASTRSTYLHAIAVAKKALVPNPMCIMVLGDNDNRKGNGSEVHLGAAEADLRVMKDGNLKRRLQMASHCLRILKGDTLDNDMIDLSLTEGPPSRAHVIIMEACIVLLSPKNRFRHPDKNVASVSWQASRRLLADFKTLKKELGEVDRENIPDENLVILQEYLAADAWPKLGQLSNTTHPFLSVVHAWVQNIVEYGAMLRAGGGHPPTLTRRNPLNLFSAVITMTDAESVIQEEDESAKVGWKATYSQMVAPLLEDVRVFREAINIGGDIHTVNVYLDCDRVFFSAYNPNTSVSFVTSIHVREINALLAPNSIERGEFGNRAPPQTREEMFSRLVHLLVLERQSRLLGYRKTLSCKRKLKRIMRETRRISGHLATITVSEDSLGELRCQAYLPQFSADLEIIVRLDMLFDVLPNADNTLETEHFKSEDAMRLLRPVTDRLAINPRLRTIQDMGLDPMRREQPGGKSKRLKGGGKGGKGLFLNMRMKGGPSRTLFEMTKKFSGTVHIVTVGEVGRGGMLRIRCYNPLNSEQHELRLSETDRALVINGSNGDWRLWCEGLMKRLSLRRISKQQQQALQREGDAPLTSSIGSARMDSYRGDTKLDFNRTIFQTALNLNHQMFSVRCTLAGFVDVGDSIELRIMNTSTNEEHVLTFTEEDMKKISGVPEETENVIRLLLNDMESREQVLREMIKYVKYVNTANTKDKVVFESEWMNKDAVSMKSEVVIKLDSGRLKIAGIEAAIKVDATDQGGLKCDLEDLKRIVIQGRKQAKLNSFESAEEEMSVGVLLRDEETEEEIQDLFEYDRKNKFQYKSLGLRFARGEEELPEVDPDTLLSPTLKFDEVVSESVQEEGGGLDVVDETKGKDDPITEQVKEAVAKEEDAMAMLKEARLIFNQGVKVKHGVVEALAYEVGMVIKAYESFTDKMERKLRLEVYSPNNSGKGVVEIVGEKDLREVIGPHVEELLLPENEEEMFHHIGHNRMKIAPGLWNEDTETYEKVGDQFTVLLTRNRLYSHQKQTPLGMGGGADQEANRDVLIDRRAFRGRKILRKAIKVSGVLLQIQVFEIMPVGPETENNAPTLRVLAYDPSTGHKMVLEIPGEAVEEVIVEEKKSLITETTNRYALADDICSMLKLLFPRGLPPELILPWSKELEARKASDDDSKSRRPQEERQKRSTDLLLRAGFNLPHLEGHVNYDCVVSVFKSQDVEDAVRVNVYIPRISESCETLILLNEQRMVLNGRKVLSFPRGEPIQTALGSIIRCLKLSLQDDLKVAKKKNLVATFVYKPDKPWKAAYDRLETDEAIPNRPVGQGNVVFIPADTRGDLIIRKGVKVSNLEVLVTVSTRAKGEKAGHGLVFEAYDPATSVTSVLHVVAGELKRLVGGREELLEEDVVFETVEMLLLKLVIEKGPVGHLVMKVDANVMPDLFLTEEQKKEKLKRQQEEEELAMDDIVDGEEEKPFVGVGIYPPLRSDLEKTTSRRVVSGPKGFEGSTVVEPGRIVYQQGGEEGEGGEEEKKKEEHSETMF
ncbi:hypothetical protein TeGR_g13922 [Tetraparma gracilis]|uniref:Uncharacterized protein n=1 Tax=Tetraparma gracilis TaxID=2962635 RepID=A0ABQ6N6B5_9STRA|nr:hypothetical protein TeGR_g13922 [Tetraparma gracilis]